MTIRAADEAAIREAARELAAGLLVAFPTETVYGLGADAAQEKAVRRIYEVKGRPPGHPLIVHVTDAAQARWWAEWTADAQRLADAFWPGPLTLILKRRAGAPGWACGGQDSIGLRSPAHPVARELLAAFADLGGRGVAAPSANRFGKVSPTSAWHVADDLGGDAPTILDGGPCEVGVESTIVDLSRGEPVLLRPGGVSAARIGAALGRPLGERDAAAPRASGTLAAHYAPGTQIELLDARELDARAEALAREGVQAAAWSRAQPAAVAESNWAAMAADAEGCARQLYDTLRRLDRLGAGRILVERVPATAEWAAVADRLGRAEVGSRAQSFGG